MEEARGLFEEVIRHRGQQLMAICTSLAAPPPRRVRADLLRPPTPRVQPETRRAVPAAATEIYP